MSLFGLSGGTLYLKKFAADVPPFEATAVQLIGGALLAGLMTALLETPHVHWTPALAGAMAWNVLAMSIFGMAVYNLMMDRYGAARAASGFFIVPGASALIAWLLIDEHLKPLALIGLIAATHRRRAGVVEARGRSRQNENARLSPGVSRNTHVEQLTRARDCPPPACRAR